MYVLCGVLWQMQNMNLILKGEKSHKTQISSSPFPYLLNLFHLWGVTVSPNLLALCFYELLSYSLIRVLDLSNNLHRVTCDD